MTKHALAAALLLSLASFAACGKDQPGGATVFNQPGDDGDGGADGDGSGLGPTIKILEPAHSADPNKDKVLTEGKLTVRCSVERGEGVRASDVDAATVKVSARDPRTMMIVQTATKALANDVYEGVIDLTGLTNGTLEVTCKGADLDGNVKTKTVESLLDLGPAIEILEPKDGSVHSLKSPTSIRFRVTPAPLSDDDKEADVKQIELHVAGVAIPFKDADKETYEATVDFQDQSLFGNAPTMAEVAVTAKDTRTPTAAMRKAVSKISIDSKGPTIIIKTPTNLQLVRATVLLSMTIMDTAGVEPGSVVASINDGKKVITDWKVMGNLYAQTFDTRDFPSTLVQLTINVSAYDTVGNITTRPVVVRLDNVPPLVSMDPPWIRQYTEKATATTTVTTCSMAFDPLWDAVSDKEDVMDSSLYRVFVNDRTNQSTGGKYRYNADVDPDTVYIFAQGDTSIPLLVDADGDGNGPCDEINSDDLPEADRPTVLKMSPVFARGAAWYTSGTNFKEPNHTVSGCTAPTGAAKPHPAYLCPVTPAYRIVAGWLDSKPPAVYGFSPTNVMTGECAGGTWELSSVVGTGWACIAARAVDKIGNVGISRPLRVCVGGGCSGTPPSCTNGCDLPDDYDKNMLWKN